MLRGVSLGFHWGQTLQCRTFKLSLTVNKDPSFDPQSDMPENEPRVGLVGSHSAQILLTAHGEASCQPGTAVAMSCSSPCRPTPGSRVQR